MHSEHITDRITKTDLTMEVGKLADHMTWVISYESPVKFDKMNDVSRYRSGFYKYIATK